MLTPACRLSPLAVILAFAVGPPIPPDPEVGESPVLLLLALTLFAVSVFLLHEAAAFQSWALRSDNPAPKPNSGFVLTAVATAVLVLCSFLFSMLPLINLRGTDLPSQFIRALVAFPFVATKSLSIALLFASLLPGVIAAFKFIVVGRVARSYTDIERRPRRSPLATLAAGLFTLLQLAASIVTLVVAFR